jgi:hypothetical protein
MSNSYGNPPGSIPEDVTGKPRELAEAIIALLRERKSLGTCYIGHRDEGALFTVFWEGTDASPFFSMDHCIPAGKWVGSAEDYAPWEEMLALCIKHNAHPENSWGASPVWGDNNNEGASQ